MSLKIISPRHEEENYLLTKCPAWNRATKLRGFLIAQAKKRSQHILRKVSQVKQHQMKQEQNQVLIFCQPQKVHTAKGAARGNQGQWQGAAKHN